MTTERLIKRHIERLRQELVREFDEHNYKPSEELISNEEVKNYLRRQGIDKVDNKEFKLSSVYDLIKGEITLYYYDLFTFLTLMNIPFDPEDIKGKYEYSYENRIYGIADGKGYIKPHTFMDNPPSLINFR